jgi:hypothetical protein
VFFYYVDNTGSWQRSAAGSWCRTNVDGFAQGGGTVWRHGGVDGRSVKIIADIYALKKMRGRWWQRLL